jgi:hypothetical protein
MEHVPGLSALVIMIAVWLYAEHHDRQQMRHVLPRRQGREGRPRYIAERLTASYAGYRRALRRSVQPRSAAKASDRAGTTTSVSIPSQIAIQIVGSANVPPPNQELSATRAAPLTVARPVLPPVESVSMRAHEPREAEPAAR